MSKYNQKNLENKIRWKKKKVFMNDFVTDINGHAISGKLKRRYPNTYLMKEKNNRPVKTRKNIEFFTEDTNRHKQW